MENHTYLAEIKEKMTDAVIKPVYKGQEMTKEKLEEFWGLKEDDIQWYRLYEVLEDGTKKEM